MSSVYQILRDGSSGDTDTHPPYANGKRAALPRDPEGDSGKACSHLPSQTRTGFYFLRGFPVSKSKTCGSCDHPQQRNTPPANLGEECTSLFPFPRNVGILHLVGMGICVSLYSPSRHGRVGSLMGVSRLRGHDRFSIGLHSRRTNGSGTM